MLEILPYGASTKPFGEYSILKILKYIRIMSDVYILYDYYLIMKNQQTTT